MRRGRKPKPTALKILEGVQPYRINGQEPPTEPGSTVAPAWLKGRALEHWNELAPILAKRGCLSDGDRPGLALLCEEYQRWRNSKEDSDKPRLRYVRLLTEFGLTPSSRSRLKAAPEKPDDALGDFLEAKKA